MSEDIISLLIKNGKIFPLTKIFEYISDFDIVNIGQTCSLWRNYTINHNCFHSHLTNLLKENESYLDMDSNQLIELLNKDYQLIKSELKYIVIGFKKS